MAVLRNRVGLLEDRFFATVFLGSGLLFVAMLFAAVAVARGLLDTFATAGRLSAESETYAVGRAMAHALMNTFGMKMAAIFMFVTSSIGLRTAVLTRRVSLVGFALGLMLLSVIGDFASIALVFPFWVLLVSAHILVADYQHEARWRPRTGHRSTIRRRQIKINQGQVINHEECLAMGKVKNHRRRTHNSP